MSLPNYAPSGVVLLGSVPWDNSYTNVRLYTSLSTQYTDIAGMMKERAEDYVYIGRDRRLKVNIEADRLYHCNYCMYRNESLTDGWIYCFITNVTYVNDHTTEITLETDVFNTYLYGVDWTIPACFIERETVPSESSKYLLTNEMDFPLTYVVTAQNRRLFKPAGFCIVTGSSPTDKSKDIIEDFLNPEGWFAEPAPVGVYRGTANGANYYYIPYESGKVEYLEYFLNAMTYAGAIDSIVAIITVPDIASVPTTEGFTFSKTDPYAFGAVQDTFNAPSKGSAVDGYKPRNSKLLYYPYNFCRLTDYNGSTSDLRYELMDSLTMNIKYAITVGCEALVYPASYRGIVDLESGIVTKAGAQGSWPCNQYQTWLAQHGATIALDIASIALTAVPGGVALSTGARLLSTGAKLERTVSGMAAGGNKEATKALALGVGMQNTGRTAISEGAMGLGFAGSQAANLGANINNQSKVPTVTRGEINLNSQFMTGTQGVAAQRICVKAEIAQQIDQFFDRFGYAVERIEGVNITSRPYWNYVKTVGSAPKSTDTRAGTSAPFSRGRGTPAAALAIIKGAFDSGVTFWHTTDGYGNFLQNNSL